MGYGNLCQTTIMTTMYMSVGDIEDIHDKTTQIPETNDDGMAGFWLV